ncbi:MAG: IS1595 family transposase, partial [bacterium]
MKSDSKSPKTLMEAIKFFARPGVALEFMAKMRWRNGPFCDRCGEMNPMFLKSVERWKCRGCRAQFSVKRGTIMEDCPIPLDKWLCAIWMIANCRNGVSSYEVARALGVTQKSAWFMLHRIRLAMQAGTVEKIGGTIETDETFIGGKVRKMNRAARRAAGKRKGPSGKAVVSGVLERNGEIRARVLPDVGKDSVQANIREHVEPGSRLFTDSSGVYAGLEKEFTVRSVNHEQGEYARQDVHTNSIENFWSLLKRALKGTYVSVEPFHLFRYLDEEVFRFNNRKVTD